VIRFTPLRFDDSEPFGRAGVTRIYWWNQANAGDGINEDECAFDYVVCVLDRRLGDTVGWMGSRGYSTSWNGGAYWAHVGYPSDLAGGARPAFIGDGVFDSDFTRSIGGRDSFGLRHQIDAVPGQSGGPNFGWWDGEPWPRVVASRSAENWGGTGGPNTSGGGSPVPELINHARTVEPKLALLCTPQTADGQSAAEILILLPGVRGPGRLLPGRRAGMEGRQPGPGRLPPPRRLRATLPPKMREAAFRR
jgi:hypothetical protein